MDGTSCAFIVLWQKTGMILIPAIFLANPRDTTSRNDLEIKENQPGTE